MTYLDCTVTNCAYNDDKSCKKDGITIEGNHALDSTDTCCSSFVERTGNTVSNAMSKAKKETNVSCKACNCVHNKAEKCEADHIGVSGRDACVCGETECKSFCCSCND